MSKKTEWKYGLLNEVKPPKFLPSLPGNPLFATREAVRDTLYKQKVDLAGEFTGVVLSSWEEQSAIDSDSISFVSRLWNNLGGQGNKPSIIQAKVRVPELHAMIPEPDGSHDVKKIDLHTTFTGIISQIGKSKFGYGELVVVRFYDSSGAYNPQILKALNPGTNTAILPQKAGNARTALESEFVFVGPIQSQPFVGPIQNHIGKTIVEIHPAVLYKENRVRVNEGISAIPKGSSLLTNVAPRPGRSQSVGKLHKLVANRFNAMKTAAALEGIEIYSQSGWRSSPWKSREHYEEQMIETYGSVSEGKKWKAYISAHETGLGVDFYIPKTTEDEVDIAPSQSGDSEYGKRTQSLQKQTKAFKWLRNNAHKYGFTPFLREPWHWEVLLPIESWKTGAEITNEYNISSYDIRVEETSIANGSKTNQSGFTFE